MATRCPRCHKNEIALETFGVYRCPACGRIDADGKLLDMAAPPPELPPEERVSFAPPPPKAWVPPGEAERSISRPEPLETGPPTYLYAGIGLMFFTSLAHALTGGSWISAGFRWATLAALWSGRPWARSLAIFGSTLGIAIILFGLAFLRRSLPPAAVPVAVLALIAEGAWLYVLFRADTIRHFQKPR